VLQRVAHTSGTAAMVPHPLRGYPRRKKVFSLLATALTAILVYQDFVFLRSPNSFSTPPNHVTTRTPSLLRPAPVSLVGPLCSCHTETKAIRRKDPCCRRILFGVHKGGHLFVSQFRERFLPAVPSVFVRSNSTSTERMFHINKLDYREVFVARDLYEMIVSGYLYHKSGRECWLDMYGKAQINENTLTEGTWEDLIQHWRIKWSWPQANNRSLCHYLSQESETDGILVYTSYAIERWYRPFFDLIDFRKQDGPVRSLFLDMQRLSDPLQQETLLREVRHFLAPNAPHGKNLASFIPSNAVSMAHDHGHDTSHDLTLRTRLTNLIRKVDEVVWDGWIVKRHQWPPVT
jgi:hypothetical protein